MQPLAEDKAPAFLFERPNNLRNAIVPGRSASPVRVVGSQQEALPQSEFASTRVTQFIQ